MSKSKKSKKRTRTPNLSPISVLRPRLDALWDQIDVTALDSDRLKTALTKLTVKLQAPDFLPILLRTYSEKSELLHTALDETLITWLQEHQYIDELSTLVTVAGLPVDSQNTAISWLRSTNVDVDKLLADRPNLFYKAYMTEEKEGMPETYLWVFCYTNHRRHRVNGFLICTDSDDHWSSAISMSYFSPARPVEEIEGEHLAHFEQQFEVELIEIDAEEAKQWACHALHQNIAMDIRPTVEFLNERRTFMEIMGQLPDATDATALTFTEADFDQLGKLNKLAEDIMKAEKEMEKMIRARYNEQRWDDDDE